MNQALPILPCDVEPLPLHAIIPDRHSPPVQKVALFRSLFRGRTDVYPRRFQSRKTGKAGHEPVCGNEWICADIPHYDHGVPRGSVGAGIVAASPKFMADGASRPPLRTIFIP